jgi:phenylpyruvate tautomerase PptA (4-oxalocrotonate tautomerase family)
MPYLEVLAPPMERAAKAKIVADLTARLVETLEVGAHTITFYFVGIAPEDYGHAGQLTYADRTNGRVLIKVHAYRRGVEVKRRAVREITDAFAQLGGSERSRIAVYFLEREFDEVAHDGQLSCDTEQGHR